MPRLSPEQDKALARQRAAIARRVAKNPYEYLPTNEARILFRKGIRTWKALVGLGLPSVSQQFLPSHVERWLWDHQADLVKLTTSAEDDD